MNANGKPVFVQDGEPVKETVQARMTAFKPVSTFDISKTEGEPAMSLGVVELKGSDHHAILPTENVYDAVFGNLPVGEQKTLGIL